MEKIYNQASKKPGIYQIRNKINGKIYIGSTAEFKRRATQHEYSLRNGKHQNKHLQHAFNQYGEEAFVFEVLEVIEGKSIKRRRIIEEGYIKGMFGQETCYNVRKDTIKKKGPWSSTPEETRQKMSDSNKGKNLGKKHTEEAKKKISEAYKGKHHSLKTEFKKGHTLSEESRKKISEAHKKSGRKPPSALGKKRSEEFKRKCIESWKKRNPTTEETRKKMSAAQKRRFKNKKQTKEIIRKRIETRRKNGWNMRQRLQADFMEKI